ncbi:MAG TPA: hypothetical protein VG936_07710 [Lacunisphaera sp.]|nr:hypothetical protein [Lacunisphaera sp.]
MKKLLAALLTLLLALPVSFVVTLLLIPLWRWIEATYGLESIGHSGPADWCFEVVFGLVLLAGFALWRWFPSRRGSAEKHERR